MLTGLDKSQESPTEPKLRGRTKLNEAPTTSSQVIIATMPSKKRKLIDDAILNNSPAKQVKDWPDSKYPCLVMFPQRANDGSRIISFYIRAVL